MAYIGSSPTKVVSRQSANIFTYTATANQTAFTGADANGNTLTCSPSDIMVHMNGIKLEESDYTATTTTVTLGSGAAAGDEVTITAFLTFESADHYTKSAADTRYVNATGDTMSGDLTIDTNTFHVDVADNRVGIGTNTPAKKLHINESAAAGEGILLTNSNNTANTYSDIKWQYSPTDASYASGLRFRQLNSSHGGQLEFYTDSSTGTYTKQMQITENGHVTMPNQPSFAAGVSANNWTTSSAADAPFDSEIFDIGNNYNTSNYTFTAPVAGRYFTSLFLNRYTDSRFDIGIMVNGSARHVAEVRDQGATSGGAWHVESFQVILNLAASDAVKLRITSVTSTGTAIFDGNGTYYDVFAMHLLG